MCTGNRFRSPVVEGFLCRQLAPHGVSVESAGLQKLGPVPALPEIVALCASVNLDVSAHRARSLSGLDLVSSDLVIGFERAHVVEAVVEAHARREATFTLLELLELCDGIEVPRGTSRHEQARAIIARAAARRGRRLWPGADNEIPDPLGQPGDTYAATVKWLGALSEELAQTLFGPPSPEGLSSPDG